MFVFWMVLVGLMVGLGAGLLLHTRGYVAPIVLGIVGSSAAALIGRGLGWTHGAAGAGGITLSVCGAILALALYGIAAKRLSGGRR